MTRDCLRQVKLLMHSVNVFTAPAHATGVEDQVRRMHIHCPFAGSES